MAENSNQASYLSCDDPNLGSHDSEAPDTIDHEEVSETASEPKVCKLMHATVM